jgi:DNA repair and recombination protein RAD54B
MGLGKTLSTISVIHAFSRCDIKTIVVVPASLVDNWRNEFRHWLGVRMSPIVVQSGDTAVSTINTFTISRASRYPVLLTTYDLFRRFAVQLNQVPRLDLLVCDEGHRLKNADGTKTMDALQLVAG